MDITKSNWRLEQEQEKRNVWIVVISLGIVAVGILTHYYFIGQYL